MKKKLTEQIFFNRAQFILEHFKDKLIAELPKQKDTI